MVKHLDTLRRVVNKLSARYGTDDPHVSSLWQELQTREDQGTSKSEERRKMQVCRYTFGSVAKQHFLNSRPSAAGAAPGAHVALPVHH